MPLCFYTVCSRFSVKHLLSYMSFFINIISNIFFIPVLLRYLDWIWFFFHVVIFFYKKASRIIAVMSKPIWNKILPWWINKSINPDCKLEYRYCVLLCLLIMSIFFLLQTHFPLSKIVQYGKDEGIVRSWSLSVILHINHTHEHSDKWRRHRYTVIISHHNDDLWPRIKKITHDCNEHDRANNHQNTFCVYKRKSRLTN